MPAWGTTTTTNTRVSSAGSTTSATGRKQGLTDDVVNQLFQRRCLIGFNLLKPLLRELQEFS